MYKVKKWPIISMILQSVTIEKIKRPKNNLWKPVGVLGKIEKSIKDKGKNDIRYLGFIFI